MRNSNDGKGRRKFNSSRPDKRKPSNRRGKFGNKNKAVSKIDPATLIKAASNEQVKQYESNRTFEELPIADKLKVNLAKKGYRKPSEIQDKTLEAGLSGNDILGIAETGSGKTAAFLIPIIEQLLKSNQKPYALILVPTRELAKQVEDEFRSMTKGMQLYASCFIGGTNINTDIKNCRRPSHVVVATPGRLLDLSKRKVLNLANFESLVLDEFDRMLDMGFQHDVLQIIDRMKRRERTQLFSATVDKKQKPLIDQLLNDPTEVRVTNGQTAGSRVEQTIYLIQEGENKLDALCDMLRKEEFVKVIIFDEAKHRVKRLNRALLKKGFASDEIHGNKTQNARQQSLNKFKAGKTNILVATDVAARGIDVDDISHVINYQLPMNYDSYIHRIGRTGRAGKSGTAITFVDK